MSKIENAQSTFTDSNNELRQSIQIIGRENIGETAMKASKHHRIKNLATYKQQYLVYEILFETLEDYIMNEMVKNFKDSSPWDLVSLPSVIKCAIYLIYPSIGDTTAVDYTTNLPLHFSCYLTTIFQPKQGNLLNTQLKTLLPSKIFPDENDVYHFTCKQRPVESLPTNTLDFLEINELDELNFIDSVNVRKSDDKNEVYVSFPLNRVRVLYKNNIKPSESMLKLLIDTISMQLSLDEQDRPDKKQLHRCITIRLSVIDISSIQSQTKPQCITFS
ncbi:unnamed protein product, partial [Didymodactylos carnosus]